jgi:glucose uptake protein GlcU
MKKRLFRVLSMAVLVLLIGVSVTGCQKQEKAENDSSAAAEAAPDISEATHV